MVAKGSKNAKPKQPGFGDIKFINYSLSDEQKRELKATPYTAEEFSDDLDRVTNSGYKVSFSEDEYNQCASVFFTPKDAGNVNKGLILTARGSTMLKAFKQAMYLHYKLFEENWTDWYTPTGREPLDD